MKYNKTVEFVDIPKFMGTWYVWAGRTTFVEKGAYSSIEKYTWNAAEDRIDVDFSYHQDSFDGKLKKTPQKAWIENKNTNAQWKVQPFWPLKFDYLVIDLDPDYQWTVIGVPSGSYVWIMGRIPIAPEHLIEKITARIKERGYPVQDIINVPQQRN